MAPKNVDDIYPLSPMQRLMLLHELTAAQPDVLTNQLRYRITGGLDEAAFRRACETVVARHPALRTGFLWEGFEQPLQVVRGTVRGFVRSVDATGIGEEQRVTRLDDIAAEDRRALQELSRAPLLRCTLVRTDMAEHLLIWTVHHLVADRWSHATVIRELRACYSAMTQEKVPDLAPAPAFRDYIHWISNQDAEAARRFWSSELEGLSTPTRIAGVGPRASSPQRQTCRRILSEDQTERLERRSTEWRTTPASLLLAGIGLAVARRTRTHEPVVGLTVAGRPPTLPTVEDAVGSFVNNVPVRFHLDRQHPVSEWVREVFVGQIRRQPFEHVSLADIQQAA
ncbi:MAG: condensation domain-containing protein, partial [Gemmatimonadota bacterium]